MLSSVFNLSYRHPLVAAKSFATLDLLSGGRTIIGVGAGHVEKEFAALDGDGNLIKFGERMDGVLKVAIKP